MRQPGKEPEEGKPRAKPADERHNPGPPQTHVIGHLHTLPLLLGHDRLAHLVM
ncbi:hypothetical protein [Streptomyces sp. NPDC052012]|uniref:hypothetical protein n=1 Tax=Streptomyces sp. NPDC052012 TaxID=3155051 RepID=UPI0034509D21